MKKLLIAVAVSVLLVMAAMIWAAVDLVVYARRPGPFTGPGPVIVTVSPGQPFGLTVRALHSEGVISHPHKFKLVARGLKLDRKIIAGEYEFSSAATPLKVLEDLNKGRVRLRRVTVPEGYNLVQIAEAVAAAGICDKQSFFAAVADPALADRMKMPATGFEGYLFPDTYYFSKNTKAEQIVASMTGQFEKTFGDDWRRRAESLGFTVHEIVTLASIIEKETGCPEERPLVASVFHNRLKQGMRLDSDPTVIYGISGFNGNLTREDLKQPTPYNTYVIHGLPPGPIASPGAASLQAALYPAGTEYLYFVATGEKGHYFSKTLEEHNQAVRRYQLNRKAKSGPADGP